MASTATQAAAQSIPLRLSRMSPAVVTSAGALLSVFGLALVEWVGEIAAAFVECVVDLALSGSG